jgi:hypothetical protein
VQFAAEDLVRCTVVVDNFADRGYDRGHDRIILVGLGPGPDRRLLVGGKLVLVAFHPVGSLRGGDVRLDAGPERLLDGRHERIAPEG